MTFNRRNLIVRNSDRGRAVPTNRDSQRNIWTLPAIFILLITVNASARSDPELVKFLQGTAVTPRDYKDVRLRICAASWRSKGAVAGPA